MKKLISFMLSLVFFLSFSIVAYAEYPPIFVKDTYELDYSSVPDTADVYDEYKSINLNIFLFYDPSNDFYYLIGLSDEYSAYGVNCFFGHESDYSKYYLYRCCGSQIYNTRYGSESDVYRVYYYSSSHTEWTSLSENSTLFYSKNYTPHVRGFDITGLKLIAFEMNSPQYENGVEKLTFQYFVNGTTTSGTYFNTNIQELNPATRRLYFNNGSLYSYPGGSSGESGSGSGESGSGGNTIVNIDLSSTNSLLAEIKTKIETVNQNVQTISTGVNLIFDRLLKVNSIYDDLHELKLYLIGDGDGVIEWLSTISDNLYDIFIRLGTNLQSNSPNGTVINHLNNIKLKIYDIYTYLTVDLVTYFDTKYEMLYNVILYGNKNGNADYQQERLELQQRQQQLDGLNAKLDTAPATINSSANDVSSYIQTFTEAYNGFIALNAVLSSVLYFGLAVIVIKKVIGR